MNTFHGKRLALPLLLAVQLLLPRVAAGSIHYMIVSPLLKPGQHVSSKDSFSVDLSSSTSGQADFMYFPPGGSPQTFTYPLNYTYFTSSGSRSFVDDVPVLYRVNFINAPSYVTLRTTGAKEQSTIAVPQADFALARGFVFPVGDPGARTTVYVGNPNANLTLARLQVGGPAIPPVRTLLLAPWTVGTFVLDASQGYSRIQVEADSPCILMLETIDAQGNISRTFIDPA